MMKDLDAGPMERRFFPREPSAGTIASDAESTSGACVTASVHTAVGKVLDGPNGLACRVVQ